MIKKVLYIFLLSFLISCGSSKKVTQSSSSKRNSVKKRRAVNRISNSEPSIADKIVWTAVTYKGTPYKYAGISRKGMDCSGLIYTSFKKRDVIVPRSSGLLYKEGYRISLREVKRGDLLFFKTTNKTRSKINHVALVTSVTNGVISFIHSTSSKGVIVSTLNQNYWKRAFIEAKRVL